MTVIASYIYKLGKRAEVLSLTGGALKQRDGEFAWIGITDPTVEEMASLQSMFDLHPLAVEDALNGKLCATLYYRFKKTGWL